VCENLLQILIIEHDAADYQLLAQALRASGVGCAIQQADTAAALSQALSKQRWDMVIADYALPDGCAREALQLIRAQGVDAPLILVADDAAESMTLLRVDTAAEDTDKTHDARLLAAARQGLQQIQARRAQRQAEAARRDNEHTLATLMANLPGMAYRCHNNPQWTMEFISDGCRQLLGYAAADLLQDHKLCYRDTIHPEDRDAVWAQTQAAVRSDAPFQLEYRVITATGETRWVLAQGRRASAAGTTPVLLEGFAMDISAHKRMAASLAKTQQSFRDLLYHNTTGTLVLDREGTVLFSNPAAHTLLGREANALHGIQFGLPTNTERTTEIEVLRPNQTVGVVEVTLTSIEWEGRPAFLLMLHDITERKHAEAKIRHMAYHDGLTDLPNRVLFHDRLVQALARAKRNQQLLAVLFIDLDGFKSVNDAFGHGIGDQLLRIVAARLSGCVRETDTVARQGGDEFTLILEAPTDSEAVQRIAEKILHTIQQPVWLNGREVTVGASIGISRYPHDGHDPNALLEQADAAMYQAKELGKNTVQFYTAALGLRFVHRMRLENRLRGALERREFILHYQPQVAFPDGRIVGAEALLYWRDPEQGLTEKSTIIHLLEETQLSAAVNEWALHEACAQNQTWQAAGLPLVPIAVDLSARYFNPQTMVTTVQEALAQTGLQTGGLSITITESELMQDLEAVRAALHTLHRLGVQVELSRFGAGCSSLSCLKGLVLDRLQIDRSFIQQLPDASADAAIVDGIIRMAHNLGVQVLAEGVETPAQRDFLWTHGCTQMQGRLFSPPLPAAAMAALLENNQRVEHALK